MTQTPLADQLPNESTLTLTVTALVALPYSRYRDRGRAAHLSAINLRATPPSRVAAGAPRLWVMRLGRKDDGAAGVAGEHVLEGVGGIGQAME